MQNTPFKFVVTADMDIKAEILKRGQALSKIKESQRRYAEYSMMSDNYAMINNKHKDPLLEKSSGELHEEVRILQFGFISQEEHDAVMAGMSAIRSYSYQSYERVAYERAIEKLRWERSKQQA